MSRPLLMGWQLLTGLSDSCTGALLIAAPGFALRLMRIEAPPEAEPYLSFIGAFVLGVGLSCLYGAWIVRCSVTLAGLQIVWILTSILRFAVAFVVLAMILRGALATGWLTVALFDGAIALTQAVGLRLLWLSNVAS